MPTITEIVKHTTERRDLKLNTQNLVKKNENCKILPLNQTVTSVIESLQTHFTLIQAP